MPEYPNPEFNESKELLNAAQDPTEYPNRKWSYDGQELDVWPVTPMAFPEHKDVWGPEGSATFSQGHLWYDPEVEEWKIWQWPERPRELSTEWYHPIQKARKEEMQAVALEAIKDYVREKCHAEPFIADRPMPADDAGQAMYMKYHMGEIPYHEMDRLRRQASNVASYHQQPDPDKWDALRDEVKDETDPTQHPNRKWSHTWGPSGFLDVWPVDDNAYPEHVDVWGNWGWENCSQGHLWYDPDDGKWMIWTWRERPHCLSDSKPKEAEVKKKFQDESTKAVVDYVKNVLHGEPQIAAGPMPVDTYGQQAYKYKQQTSQNPYNRNTPEHDIQEIFAKYLYGDESIYWDVNKGVVWWYSPDPEAEQDLAAAKRALYEIPEVKNVTIMNKRPAGPWKKIASAASEELAKTFKVKILGADDWQNDKGHVPGIYNIDNNTLYLASGPGHHGDIMEELGVMNTLNTIGLDFKTPNNCVIIAPSPDTPREYLDLLNEWIEESRPSCSVAVEFNGEDESRLPFDKYMHQVYEVEAGWDPHFYNKPPPHYDEEAYCHECDEYGHTDADHNPPPSIDWGALSPAKQYHIKSPINQSWPGYTNIDGHDLKIGDIFAHNPSNPEYFKVVALDWQGDPSRLTVVEPGKEWDGEYGYPHSLYTPKSSGDIWIPDKKKTGSSEFHWWLYDLDTGEIAVAPKEYRSIQGLEGELNNPDRWIRGRYWSGRSPEIKIDGYHKVASDMELNDGLNKVIRRLLQQEGMSKFFAATTDDIIPREHQTIGYLIWYADERDEVVDRGIRPGDHIIFKDEDKAEQTFSKLKNVDLWEIDLTGMDLQHRPGYYYTTDQIYPEQMAILFGPHNPPQKQKYPDEQTFAWSYNMENGELVVAPDDKLPSDHWSTLDYPVEWMSGTYNLDGDLTITQSPPNLDINRQKEYSQDILKKLKTLPFV